MACLILSISSLVIAMEDMSIDSNYRQFEHMPIEIQAEFVKQYAYSIIQNAIDAIKSDTNTNYSTEQVIKIINIIKNKLMLDVGLISKNMQELSKDYIKRNLNKDLKKYNINVEEHIIDAALYHEKEYLKSLINSGLNIDINAKDKYGYSALEMANIENDQEDNNLEIVRILLDNGANVNLLGTDNYTPLMRAIDQSAHMNIVELLINKGTNIELRGDDGLDAIMLAVINNRIEIAELLIEKGANINRKYTQDYADNQITPLIAAVEHDYKDMVKLLIDNGANVNDQDNDGKTALNYTGNPEIIGMLRAAGAR